MDAPAEVRPSDAPLSEAEIAEIHRRYGALMLRRCRVVLRDDAGADDALQEAFINLIRYGAGFREAERPIRWLYRVCDRACYAQAKKRKRAWDAPDTGAAAPPAHASVRIESRDVVLKVLHGLDEREREVAVMACVDGMSQGEIGAATGWSRQTVNKKLQQIRARAEALLRGSA